MHLSNSVVTLVDSKGKPFRELASTRTQFGGRMCDIVMPFNTEYGFLVKNQNNCRVMVDIDIDGTNVTSGGLILNANSSEIIERFVDNARKFKFVRASHEAVADPTNPDNGEIRVRITREMQVRYVPVPFILEGRNNRWPRMGTWCSSDSIVYGHSSQGPTGEVGLMGPKGPRGADGPAGDPGIAPMSMLRSFTTSCAAPTTGMATSASDMVNCCNAGFEKGATVEGSHSKQTFGTTHWNGSDPNSEVTFVFNLRARSAQDESEYAEYLRLQKKFG